MEENNCQNEVLEIIDFIKPEPIADQEEFKVDMFATK